MFDQHSEVGRFEPEKGLRVLIAGCLVHEPPRSPGQEILGEDYHAGPGRGDEDVDRGQPLR
jgi:hypothetical protein